MATDAADGEAGLADAAVDAPVDSSADSALDATADLTAGVCPNGAMQILEGDAVVPQTLVHLTCDGTNDGDGRGSVQGCATTAASYPSVCQ